MQCWNSTFNAQGLRINIVIVQVGAAKIYVAAVKALMKKDRGDETQFTTKIGGKNEFGFPLFSFVEFILSYTFDALLCRNWPFSSPNHLTLPISLLGPL
jgi:hypothetical protein